MESARRRDGHDNVSDLANLHDEGCIFRAGAFVRIQRCPIFKAIPHLGELSVLPALVG